MPMAPRRACVRSGCNQLQPCSVHVRHKAPGQSFAERRASEPWRALYETQRWRKARKAYLAAHPLCVACEKAGRTTLATTVDHVVPHRGDERLMWDSGNWSAMCARCHSRKTASETWHARR